MIGIATAEPTPDERIAPSPSPDSVCTCRKCGEAKPIEAFRITSKRTGKRDTRCRACYNAYARSMALRYNRKRRERRRRQLAGALADARTRHSVEEIGNALIAACGGIEGFVGYWVLHMRTLQEQRPGSLRALRACSSVMNVLAIMDGFRSLPAVADDLRRGRTFSQIAKPGPEPEVNVEEAARDFSQMSNEELHAILRQEQEAREPRGGRRSALGDAAPCAQAPGAHVPPARPAFRLAE